MSWLISTLSALVVVSFAFTIYEDVPKPFVPGPVHLLKAYQKYGATPPRDLLDAVSQGSVTATPNAYDAEYLSPVIIGGQTLNLELDTGSADLWVFSSKTPSSQRAGHHIYDPSKSSTAEEMSGYTWSITYPDGTSSSGNVYTDTVNVGGTIVTGQAVELAEQVSADFVDGDADGVLGLSYLTLDTIKPTPQNTFFENAVNDGLVPVFTADLKKGAPGSYDFGFIDSTKYNGAITYVPVIGNDTWKFTLDGYAVGSGQPKISDIDSIVDTGTSLLLLVSGIVSAYYAEVSGASYNNTLKAYTFPCSVTLPSLTLTIGTYNAVIPGTYLNAAPAEGTLCFGGLQNEPGIGYQIFGDVFIKSQFVVFDLGNKQLGFAAKKSLETF